MRNPCAVYNGDCSHICLLSPTSGSRRSCQCPTTMRLRKDKKTCESLCKYRFLRLLLQCSSKIRAVINSNCLCLISKFLFVYLFLN